MALPNLTMVPAPSGTQADPSGTDPPSPVAPRQGERPAAPQAGMEWKAYPSKAGPFTFPEDEGFHPASGEEWWYVSGHLASGSGDRYDFMVCFYRHGIVAASLLDVSRGLYLNHSEAFLNVQRERGSLGLSYGPNALDQVEGSPFAYALHYVSPRFSLSLSLDALRGPLVVNGDGVIRMGSGDSYYYSLPDIEARGTLSLGPDEMAVSGGAWMDRQWGYWSPALDWDWYSIKLDNGMQVLAYRIIDDGGPIRLLVSAVDGAGKAFHAEQTGDSYQMVLGYGDYWRSPDTGKLYSSGWELSVPALGLRLAITPALDAQETLFPADTTPLARAKPFWEGACLVAGQLDGAPVTGRAFVESTLDYGGIWGDLVLTPKEYVQDGDHSRIVVMVENRGGRSIEDVEVRLVSGSPLEGGKILATYNLNNRHNSTVLSSSLPNIGDTPLYIIVDPDNRMAESDEGNNMVVATLK